ncbi:glutathione S-transferase [Aspergillus leporis]|uniref:Glutathione S-transferase n=1 Tax=Aspergillus leporis TaxID=41062 RepID=A0A5N5X895_9EURO|nr:glutathione S-transferase [Aspergillus leporis]
MQYLIDTYDKDNRISYATFSERYHSQTWLHFHMSGQDPYYGQAGWFVRSHLGNVPSAIERYRNEIRRITGVLGSVLRNQTWLVGDKCTYADLCFVPWQKWAPILGGDDIGDAFPLERWINEMKKRPAVAKVLEDQERALAESKNASE